MAVTLAACGGSGDSGNGKPENVKVSDWGGVINPGGEPVRGGTLRIDTYQAPEGISPLALLHEPTNEGIQVAAQMFDQLVEYLPGSLDPKPGLAESWTISDDGLTWTFKLRKAQFSNGMPVTSADVRYLLDFARGPQSLSPEQYGAISRIETPDSSTVVLQLSTPSPGLLYTLGTITASIVPAKLVKSMGVDAFNAKPIGSGPFVLKRWKRDQEVQLVRNKRYWREGLPYLDAVNLVATRNDNTRVLSIDSGETDVADYIPFSQIKRIDASGDAKVLIVPSGDMATFFVNNSKKPLDETAVRQALCYATPVESIIKVVFAGQAPRMNTIIPKVKYWTDKAKAYPYDPDKAKQLLASSSVPNGFSVSLQIDSSDQASSQIAQIVKQAWAKVGVEVKLLPIEATTKGDNLVAGDYELMSFRPGEFTTDVPVDDQFALLLFDSPETHNLFTYSKNPRVAKLVSEAVVELDEDRRAELFEQMHVESMKDPAVIPLVYTPQRAAVRNDVHDFNYLLGGFWRLDTVWKD